MYEYPKKIFFAKVNFDGSRSESIVFKVLANLSLLAQSVVLL